MGDRTSMSRCKTAAVSWPLSIIPIVPSMHFALSLMCLVLASGAIDGCGLRFADNGSALPSADKTIYVARFENLTYVSGINDQFMRYMKDAIASRGRLVVVDDRGQADLLLSGTILYTAQAPASLSGVAEPLSYGDTIMIGAKLTDRRTNKVIWSTTGIASSAQASVVAQAIVPTSPQFLRQNLRGPDILNMTDMQVAATQQGFANGQMMQQLASEVYADMAWGL